MLNYLAPSTVEEAVSILAGASGVAKVLSGGTDLLVQLRSGRVKPDLIVDIKKIPGMSGIREQDGAFIIGAATSGAEIGECEALQAGLARRRRGRKSDRLDPGAGPGIARRQSLQCVAGGRQRPGADRRAGDLRGCGHQRTARGSGGEYRHRSGRTSLKPGEFIVEFHLPKRPPRSADAYLRFIPRTEMDIAVVGAGVSVTLDPGGVCTDARVVLGAVAPTAILVAEAAAALIGRKLDETALAALDQAARRACKPIDDKRGTIEYRTKVAGVMARRAAAIAYERAGKQR